MYLSTQLKIEAKPRGYDVQIDTLAGMQVVASGLPLEQANELAKALCEAINGTFWREQAKTNLPDAYVVAADGTSKCTCGKPATVRELCGDCHHSFYACHPAD